ncbi:MAG: helix-turn-helix domain-containing protein [Thermoanaerobaculia bacterium]
MLDKSLTEAGGNQSRVAKMLGISRQALAYQIRELGIAVWPRG